MRRPVAFMYGPHCRLIGSHLHTSWLHIFAPPIFMQKPLELLACNMEANPEAITHLEGRK